MAATQQVANAFTVEFIERVAKGAASVADFYGRQVTLTVKDFVLGISEVHDADVPLAVQKWAASMQGSRLRVDSVNAAPIYGGVNVFVALTAVGEMEQYYHIATTLESFRDMYGIDGFYIRHQVIARIGAIVPEPTPAPTPAPAAPEKQEAPTKSKSKSATPEPEAAPAQPEPEAQPEPVEEPAAPAAAPEKAAEEKSAPAAVAASGKPKSWASLVSRAPVKAAEHKPVRVVAHEGGKKATPEPAAQAPASPAAKRPPPRERKPLDAVGDRLMFNTTGSVTDEEIRGALGSMNAHLVSLRNNSAKGHVFMDFAEKVDALAELSKSQPLLGASKVKMSVFRQRARESA
ncbi:RNA-binding protein 42 (RNA-binding motif protein 42) [Novymonas esmeraldas]|uniref:RNA-binding protein 42 (RNA-binding motif protein 42) n=1 Tax=Novymonas esmeraldas TaxID=1808958 RepID=A0AAW0EP64_9TRYP